MHAGRAAWTVQRYRRVRTRALCLPSRGGGHGARVRTAGCGAENLFCYLLTGGRPRGRNPRRRQGRHRSRKPAPGANERICPYRLFSVAGGREPARRPFLGRWWPGVCVWPCGVGSRLVCETVVGAVPRTFNYAAPPLFSSFYNMAATVRLRDYITIRPCCSSWRRRRTYAWSAWAAEACTGAAW